MYLHPNEQRHSGFYWQLLAAAILLSLSFLTSKALADGGMHKHGGEVYQSFHLAAGLGRTNHSEDFDTWDLDGWIGTDENKLAIKSEAEFEDGTSHKMEFWALYSRNISEFWDGQIGLRHDTRPIDTGYLVFGFAGLAPYFIETEVHLFLSDEGDLSTRIDLDTELFFTQQLALVPYLELDAYAQDVKELEVGAGFSKVEFGLQLRYGINRRIAPYIDFRYERLLGETSSIAKAHGEDHQSFIGIAGLQLSF